MSDSGMVRQINLDTLRHNIQTLRGRLPSTTKLLCVIKADAYGHGAPFCARNALAAGADWLAVATAAEGLELRKCGIQAPILILGPSDAEETEQSVRNGLTMTVCSSKDVENIRQAVHDLNCEAYVHLKLDTGMHRIGVRTLEERNDLLNLMTQEKGIRLTGAFTHFADADGPDEAYTRKQFERFLTLTDDLKGTLIRHCSNSAAMERFMPEMALDMVRAGIIMYGYPPVPTDMDLEPVMEWTTSVTFIKEIQAGDAVSYGCTFVADHPMRIATVRCGYGDGYHRAASGRAEVLIRGHRCRVVGRICMDQMMVDVSEVPDIEIGDRVTLIGKNGQQMITAEDIARWADTISYEVLLSCTDRVKKIWKGDL